MVVQVWFINYFKFINLFKLNLFNLELSSNELLTELVEID